MSSIVTLASYWCAFSTVQTGIEQRYGRRAARLYTRTERTFARQFERPGMAATPETTRSTRDPQDRWHGHSA